MAYSAMTALAYDDIVTEAEWDKIKDNFDFFYTYRRSLSRCVSVKTTDQAISDVSDTTVDWTDSDTADTDAYHDPASNSTRFYAPVTGDYIVLFSGRASGSTYFWTQVNGSATVPNGRGADGSYPQIAVVVSMTAGQYLTIAGRASSGAKTLYESSLLVACVSGGI